MIHGFTAGTDSGTGWARAVYIGALAAVLAAVAWRLRRPAPTVVPARSRPAVVPARVPITTGGSK
jgi:hypothetical protein